MKVKTVTLQNSGRGDMDEDAPAEPEVWGLVSDGYAAVVLPMMEYFARQALELALLPPAPAIVDVATGPGTLALLAAQDGAIVHALDSSPGMIAVLRRREAESGLRLADGRVGDGQNLPYPSDSFDGAFSIHGLMFFPDRAAGFRELHRVLKEGRRAVVSSMALLSEPMLATMASIAAVLPDLPPGNLGAMPLSDATVFRSEMSAAGFRDVVIHTVTYHVSTTTLMDFWRKMQRGAGSVTLLRHQLGEARWAEVSQAVLEDLRRTLGNGPIEEVYTAHLGVGVK